MAPLTSVVRAPTDEWLFCPTHQKGKWGTLAATGKEGRSCFCPFCKLYHRDAPAHGQHRAQGTRSALLWIRGRTPPEDVGGDLGAWVCNSCGTLTLSAKARPGLHDGMNSFRFRCASCTPDWDGSSDGRRAVLHRAASRDEAKIEAERRGCDEQATQAWLSHAATAREREQSARSWAELAGGAEAHPELKRKMDLGRNALLRGRVAHASRVKHRSAFTVPEDRL